ncbi:MAG TPA: M56 family metallopeptidase, partial [Planctomycetaceae bacterium]|nr:M56 family metallopeptidase [Planctomycetaceae bacterium]
LIALLVLPLATGLAPRLTLPLLPSDSPDTNRAADSVGVSPRVAAGSHSHDLGMAQPGEPAIAMAPIVDRDTLLWVLAGVYGFGVAVCLARLVAGWHTARLLSREAAPVTNSQWLERLDFWMSRLGLRGNRSAASPRLIRLLESDDIDVPVALGVLRPAILIPSSLVAKAMPRAVDAVLVHELAHVYRADCAWQLVDRVVQAALWLHPLMWIAQRRIAFIRERACDDFAVRMMGDFRLYGETLLDIAAGIKRRRSLGLGLAIARSSKLERRLIAIVDGNGCERCVAAPLSRWSVTAGMLLSAVALASIGFERAAAEGPPTSAGSPTTESPVAPTPELIAVTWQQVPESNGKRIEQPVWRPDGKRLMDTEANALLDQVKSFQTHWWNKEETLRPLVVVYRRPPGIHTGLMTSIVLPNGRRMGTGSWMYSLANGLAKSSCSPQRADLKSWPAKVDLDVKVPLEDPQVIKTIKSAPKGVVGVADGVRWYIVKEGGTEFLLPGMPAWPSTSGVLEIRNDDADKLITYDAKVWLRGRKDPLPDVYGSTAGPKRGELTMFRVGHAIDKLESIERVEFTRQRFRFERIKGVETHLDLLPPDP